MNSSGAGMRPESVPARPSALHPSSRSSSGHVRRAPGRIGHFPMKAEIITVGTELIPGQILDTGSAFLAQKLASIGVEPSYQVTVGNAREHVYEALSTAFRRSEVIIISGGLGATEMDLTREVVAELTENPLVYHEELMTQIDEFFHRLRRTPSAGHMRQAHIPEGALPIQNPVGSAPGFILKHRGKAIIALPGVSAELQHMTRWALIPFLVERFGIQSRVHSRILKMTGIDEPLVARELGELIHHATNPVIGLATYPGEIHIRLTARAETRDEALCLLAEVENTVRNIFGDFIYGADNDTLEHVVSRLLTGRDMTISVVETYTSGLICNRLYRTGESVLKEGRIMGRGAASDMRMRGSEKAAERLSEMIRANTGATLGLAAVSETVAGVESTNLWVAVTSAARKQITTSLMARKPEVNQARAVAFCLDQVRRFILAEIAVPPRWGTSNISSVSI